MSTELEVVKIALDKATDSLCRLESSSNSDAGYDRLFLAEEELINAVQAAHDCQHVEDCQTAWSLIAVAISELCAGYSLVRSWDKADAAEERAFLDALKTARDQGEDLPDTSACRYVWKKTGQLPSTKPDSISKRKGQKE